jgi:excisionase family DNA binding protein
MALRDPIRRSINTAIKTASEPPNMLTTEQAAWWLGLSASSVEALSAEGMLQPYHVGPRGRAVRYRRADLEAYIDSRRCRP